MYFGGHPSVNRGRFNGGGSLGCHWIGFCPGGRFAARGVLPAVKGASPVTAGSGGRTSPAPASQAMQVLRDRWRRCKRHLSNSARHHLRNQGRVREYEQEGLDMLVATRTGNPEPPEREQVEQRIQKEQSDFWKSARTPATASVQRPEEPWELLCWVTGVDIRRKSRSSHTVEPRAVY